MTSAIIKEYYMIKGTPVVMIMTDTRQGMQLWAADNDSREMKRDYDMLLDIIRGEHDGRISEQVFKALCAAKNICFEIPPKSIRNIFRLALEGQLPQAALKTTRNGSGPMTYALN